MLVGDIASLEPGSGILSVLTDEDGGIVEDTIITNVGDEYVMTIHDRYEEHFSKHMDLFKGEVFMEYLQHSILAVQAPDSPAAMSKVLPLDFDLERLAFMSSCEVLVGGIDECRLARCGFTGEDGFEIHICPTASAACFIASMLLEDPNVMPASRSAKRHASSRSWYLFQRKGVARGGESGRSKFGLDHRPSPSSRGRVSSRTLAS